MRGRAPPRPVVRRKASCGNARRRARPRPRGRRGASSALPPGLSDPQLQCDDLSDPAERNACIGVRLQAAQADHQRALERCRDLVPPGLRDDLVQGEASFAALLPARCDARAAGVDDPGLKTFVRSRCLAQALADNTRGMLAAHPECTARD